MHITSGDVHITAGVPAAAPADRRESDAPAEVETPERPSAAPVPGDAATPSGAAASWTVTPFPAGLSGQLVFQSDREGRNKIYTLDLSSGKITRLTGGPDWHDEEPVWSPDGTRIAFMSTRAGGQYDLYVMDPDGGNIVRVTDHPANEYDPSWAPDGRSLFFTAERDGHGDLYRVWLADRRVERLTFGPDRAIMPAASPDGRYVAYAAQTADGFKVRLHELATGATPDAWVSLACRPAWAPDGREVAYVLLDTEPSKIQVVSLENAERRTLVADPRLWSYYPAYSPDGRLVAFSVSPEHHEGEDWDLAIAWRDRPGEFVRLTQGPGNDRVPDWKPVP